MRWHNMENLNTAGPTIEKRKDKKNPYLATSFDGLNQAFGKTKKEALENLTKGIELRNKQDGK